MSGSTDTSTVADRLNFILAVENTGSCSVALAQAVKDCPLHVTEMVSGLLGFAGGATYRQAAEVVMTRHRNAAMARQTAVAPAVPDR